MRKMYVQTVTIIIIGNDLGHSFKVANKWRITAQDIVRASPSSSFV